MKSRCMISGCTKNAIIEIEAGGGWIELCKRHAKIHANHRTRKLRKQKKSTP